MPNRLRQFRDAAHGPTTDDFALASAHLAPALAAIFRAQHPRDIVHSAAAARWLLARDHTDPALIAAALLHDIGKGAQRRRDRVAYVVVSWLRLASLSASASSRFEVRRALARSLTHAGAGARLLSEARAPAEVIRLTLGHHTVSPADAMLGLLQQADAAS